MMSTRASLLALVLVAGCGSSNRVVDGSLTITPVSPSPVPAPAAPVTTVIITSTGMSPVELTVTAGTRVTFTNRDSLPHDVAGGPDPAHPDCHEIDAVGFLTAGQSRETAPLTTARTCEYHDHSNHSAIFTGRIVIR